MTPWRREVGALAREIIDKIEANADAETQFQIASDISWDITNAVKTSLRRKYGRVFDRIIDGPEPKSAAS